MGSIAVGCVLTTQSSKNTKPTTLLIKFKDVKYLYIIINIKKLTCTRSSQR